MTPQQIDEAARALAAARTGQPIAGLPEGVRPRTEADSYAIQDSVLARLGERIGGWKVGFSPQGGIFCAPILASKPIPELAGVRRSERRRSAGSAVLRRSAWSAD